MIRGEVGPNREATVRLRVVGSEGRSLEVESVIDTGFTESLALPSAVIASLQLSFRGAADFALADRTIARLRRLRAEVEWHGQPRGVLVVETAGGPLVGMRLLQGSRLTIDVADGGNVLIEPLSADEGTPP